MASPPKSPYRLGSLINFIPLNEESPMSTRGQRLPDILQQRSGISFAFRDQRSSYAKSDEESRGPRDELQRSIFGDIDPRKMSFDPEILMTPQMRSMRLIGNSNRRYKWQQYYKTEAELKKMKKPIRRYYERNNYLIAQYMYIDRLLDSSLPHSLIQEYNQPVIKGVDVPQIIAEEPRSARSNEPSQEELLASPIMNGDTQGKVKRTPKSLYKHSDENTRLLEDSESYLEISYDQDEGVDSGSPIVTVALYINLAANFVLLIGKIAVIALTSSLSVLASLVDAALDFLSTAIVWITTKLIARQDRYAYPIGRRRLEPVGVLVFSVIMITSFFQVALQCFSRLTSGDHSIVELGIPAIVIMVGTVAIKGFCWLWSRLIKNSSVQALAQDAKTDVVFNTFSIIFPLIGFYAKIWWLDALGGLLLSIYVMFNWASTSSEHIRNLTGAAATADQRNVLLYLTMRFAKTITYIQGLQAYHAGDKLNVEVDIVLDEDTSLKDSHDLSESLQYVLESVPTVDRAFVHADYLTVNLPTHMNQQE
jgi:cation diffusion facilitator family transporter